MYLLIPDDKNFLNMTEN